MKIFYFASLDESDLDKRIEFELPPGYFRVGTGDIKEGDLAADVEVMMAFKRLAFQLVTEKDVIRKSRAVDGEKSYGNLVCVHYLILRAGNEDHSKHMCDRCKARPKQRKGYRFCYVCEALALGINLK